MPYAIKDSPPPPAETAAAYGRTEQEVIDEDLHVTIFKSGASSNWYIQYNHPSEGQRKQSLKTKNVKEARRKAWPFVLKLRSGANANVSPFKVMKIVGHSSLDIILTYYHVSEDELLGAVDGVDFAAVLGETNEEPKNEK